MFNETSHTDRALLEQLKQGDANAFTEMYNLYHKGIYAYILDFVKVSALAEDITHEVFMKIWEVKERLTINTSFSAYLYRISHNKAIDALKTITREEKLRSEVLSHIASALPESTSVKDSTQQYEELYLQAVADLPPQRQKIFMLCREQGKSYHDVAQELGISRNTVKQHMVLALRFLRNYLVEKGAFFVPAALVELLSKNIISAIYPLLFFCSLIS